MSVLLYHIYFASFDKTLPFLILFLGNFWRRFAKYQKVQTGILHYYRFSLDTLSISLSFKIFLSAYNSIRCHTSYLLLDERLFFIILTLSYSILYHTTFPSIVPHKLQFYSLSIIVTFTFLLSFLLYSCRHSFLLTYVPSLFHFFFSITSISGGIPLYEYWRTDQ